MECSLNENIFPFSVPYVAAVDGSGVSVLEAVSYNRMISIVDQCAKNRVYCALLPLPSLYFAYAGFHLDLQW